MLNEVVDTLDGALYLLRSPTWPISQYTDSRRDPAEPCAWLADRAVNTTYRARPRDVSLGAVKDAIARVLTDEEIGTGYATLDSTIATLTTARTRLVAEFMRRWNAGLPT